jgi:succinyl-CoA--D-citramalate CoA-transferase
MIAGPFATTLLADMGADVIKIERTGGGDPLRHWPPMRDNISLWWKVTNRNKRIVSLNLKSESGAALFRGLTAQADVLVENFRPGTLERWGLGPELLRRDNPALIVVRVSGFGQTGPYSSRPGFGTVAEAMSGLAWFTGFPDKPPTLPAYPMADTMAGCFGALGALAALADRSQGSGEGQVVDVSLYEPLFRLIEGQTIAYDQLGIVKQRQGNRPEEDSPRNAFETRDEAWIALSAPSDSSFARLVACMGREDLLDDPSFQTNSSRIEHGDDLDAIIADWVKARSVDEVLGAFAGSDVAAARIYNIADIFNDPHYLARGSITTVDDEDFGPIRMQAVVPRFSREEGEVTRAGAAMGADNVDVFSRAFGLNSRDLEQLRSDDVI